MTPTEFKQELKRGLRTGYLFCGAEEYLKRYYLREVCRSVISDSSMDTFNRININADNYTPARLADAISVLPVFSKIKLIIVEELNINDMTDTVLDTLCRTLSSLSDCNFNVLILYVREAELDVGNLPKRPSKAYKALCEVLTPVNFDYETPERLLRWIAQHFSAVNVNVPMDVCRMILDFAGHDMFNLSGEIEKLSAYVISHGRDIVTSEDVQLCTARVKDIGAFDFANAILDGNTERAFYILEDFKTRREKPEIILSGISRVYSDLSVIKAFSDAGMGQNEIAAKTKIHEYKVGMYMKAARRLSAGVLFDILERCADADVKIKFTALDSYAVLDRLVAEISYGRFA